MNLFVINRCFPKKHSALATYGILALSCIVTVGLTLFGVMQLPDFGNGNGLFVFGGFILLIPLRFLYDTTVPKIVTSACASWAYTFCIFSLAIHGSELFPDASRTFTALAIQTALYAVTLVWFSRLLMDRFVEMLGQLSSRESISIMWMSMTWFWAAFIFNAALVYQNMPLLRILALITMAVCALLSYIYIYRIINHDRAIRKLEHIAYYDDLTQLRGRALLTNDSKELIGRGMEFALIFMDLDNFKSINDTYGHDVGDDYLTFFAQQVKVRLGSRGGFYRISGDEFVCLLTDGDTDEFLRSLDAIPPRLPDKETPFLGFSHGTARYPADGTTTDQLIRVADQRMYAMKKAAYEVVGGTDTLPQPL